MRAVRTRAPHALRGLRPNERGLGLRSGTVLRVSRGPELRGAGHRPLWTTGDGREVGMTTDRCAVLVFAVG